MLTASHNPPQYNGIKIFRSDSLSYIDEDQTLWKKMCSKGPLSWQIGAASAKPPLLDASQGYMEMALKTVALDKRWRVVVDPGCGATFNVAPAMLKAMGCKVTAINAQPDGYFPARKSEPTAESLKDFGEHCQNSWR